MFVLFYYTGNHKAIEIKQFQYLREIEQRFIGFPKNLLLNSILARIIMHVFYYFYF